MKPKELLFAHHYLEAVEAYRAHLRQHPEQNYYPGLGEALLCLKRYSEALEAFRKAGEMECAALKGANPFLNEIGTCLWLAGDKTRALQEWHRSVRGVLDGSINYGDAAGGATQGLLLWYGATTLKDSNQCDYAIQYLNGIRSRKRYGEILPWPRPVVSMLLGDYSFEQTLEAGTGSCAIETCLELARKDLLKRRRLSQILFYAACRERDSDNKDKFIDTMVTCCKLENPILELEWYLARNECEAARVINQGKR